MFKGSSMNMVVKNQNGSKKVAHCLRTKESFVNTIGMSIMALADLKSS